MDTSNRNLYPTIDTILDQLSQAAGFRVYGLIPDTDSWIVMGASREIRIPYPIARDIDQTTMSAPIQIDGYNIDPNIFGITTSSGNIITSSLPITQFRILYRLAQSYPGILPKSALYDTWDHEVGLDGLIKRYIYLLRANIRPHLDIETVRKFGFRLRACN